MEQETDILLPEMMTLLHSLVFSCVDRKQFAYSKTQLNIFTALALEGEMTMKRVARFAACSQEQTTRALAPLADGGCVKRRTDPENRTRVYVSLTDEGMRCLMELHTQIKTALTEKISGALTEEESETLRSSAATLLMLLKKIKEAEE